MKVRVFDKEEAEANIALLHEIKKEENWTSPEDKSSSGEYWLHIRPVQKTNSRQVSSGCILAVSTISHDGGVEWAGAEILCFFILKL